MLDAKADGGGPLPNVLLVIALPGAEGRVEVVETEAVRLEREFGPGDLAPVDLDAEGDIIPGDIGRLAPALLTLREDIGGTFVEAARAFREGGRDVSARLGARVDWDKADRDGGRVVPEGGKVDLASPEEVIGRVELWGVGVPPPAT